MCRHQGFSDEVEGHDSSSLDFENDLTPFFGNLTTTSVIGIVFCRDECHHDLYQIQSHELEACFSLVS